MELFEETIKCLKCADILKKPVVLPCGHSMCKSHETDYEQFKTIRCGLCDAEHEIPSNGFIPNKSFERVLEKNIEYAYMRKEHKAALDKFEEFVEFYERFKTLRAYPDKDVRRTVGEMRTRIESRRDEAKHKIDRHAAEALRKLDAYESECASQVDAMSTEHVDDMLAMWESELRVWRQLLATFQRDVHVWRRVKADATVKLDEMKAKFKAFQNEIYLNRLDDFKKMNLLFDADYDMIRNNVLSLEVPNLSQYKNISEAISIENDPIRALGIDWKLRVDISNGDERFIEICLVAVQQSLNKESIFVEFELAILNWHDKSKNLVHNICGIIGKEDDGSLRYTKSVTFHDLMNNKDVYDPHKDFVTFQAIIKKIEWTK